VASDNHASAVGSQSFVQQSPLPSSSQPSAPYPPDSYPPSSHPATAYPPAATPVADSLARHPAGTGGPERSVADVAARIVANVEKVIEGKASTIELALVVLLAEGHLLIEDVPGVGKTKLAKAIGRSIDCSVRRLQFTPDLLPSDVTGVSIYSADSRAFEFKPGAVFANIVVGDEINRASPKTQSALLESMEERQVSVDGTSYHLETPFMVLATQNPIDMEGTYPLPEAQLDRFMARLSMGYPDRGAEVAMLAENDTADPLDELGAVSDAAEIARLIHAARTVYVADAVKGYAVDLANATRAMAEIRLGASPRAVLQLVRAAKARAAVLGRDYVAPDDIQALIRPVFSHRILLTPDAQIAQRTADQLIADIVARTPIPAPTATPTGAGSHR
jgi:MoxR-like ATPase